MTNNEAHEVIAIEQTKLFLLNVVPIDELPSENIQETVSAYRQGDLTMFEALQDFEGYQKELGAMVRINKFLNEMIKEDR
jgi:hypothetical protein